VVALDGMAPVRLLLARRRTCQGEHSTAQHTAQVALRQPSSTSQTEAQLAAQGRSFSGAVVSFKECESHSMVGPCCSQHPSPHTCMWLRSRLSMSPTRLLSDRSNHPEP
jgi:hypothetical protein